MKCKPEMLAEPKEIWYDGKKNAQRFKMREAKHGHYKP